MFSKKTDVIEAMNEMVVVSLYTDHPQLGDEYNRMREKMTGSSTNPMYMVVSPWDLEKVLYQADYNQALEDAFGEKLARSNRRARRVAARLAPVTSE